MSETPTPKEVNPALDELLALGDRAERIFAVCRWAGVLAVVEMADGFEAAQRVVEDGPDKYRAHPDDWHMDRLSDSAKMAINYIETGEATT